MTPWLVYSREHNAFWRANRIGYTRNIDEAGRYSEAEARNICDDAALGRGPCGDDDVPEFAVPAPEAVEKAEARVATVEESLHYCNGVADLAMKHRDIAEARVAELEAALQFYADPETYVAIAFWPDPPCGAFMEDFSHVDDDWGDRPGKRARAALSALEDG